ERMKQMEGKVKELEKEADAVKARVAALRSALPIAQKNNLLDKQWLEKLQGEVKKLEKEENEAQRRLAPAKKEFAKLRRSNLPADLPGAYAVQEGKPVDANIQIRGDVSQPGPVVKRGAPKFPSTQQNESTPGTNESGRLQLAQWLTSPNNPLT